MMITRAISDRLVGAEGKIGISYIDLSEEAEFFFGNNKVFPGSGAVMIMALVECFRQLERGAIKEEDKYCFKHAEFGHSEDQSFGVLRFLHEGAELTLSDLYNLVGIISDNMAFNKLVDILGMDNIRNTFNSLGYENMQLNRKLDDEEAMRNGVENYISVPELAAIFYRLYRGQLVSASASEKIISLLKFHQRNNMIPYIFQEEITVAHLTGTDADLIIDAGLVFTEKPFILVMAVQDMDIRKAENLMRDITQICYRDCERP